MIWLLDGFFDLHTVGRADILLLSILNEDYPLRANHARLLEKACL